MVDPRAPERLIHSVSDILRFRMLMIAAGYEDAKDANSLRQDPAFKLAAPAHLNHGQCRPDQALRRNGKPRDPHHRTDARAGMSIRAITGEWLTGESQPPCSP